MRGYAFVSAALLTLVSFAPRATDVTPARRPSGSLNQSTVTNVTAGRDHTCAVTSGAAIHCWGRNSAGQLGDGTTTQRTSPVRVSGTHSFAEASLGTFHTCAVTTAGTGLCWGSNSAGQLGNGASTGSNASTPVAIAGGLSFSRVVAGDSHSCGVATDGAVYCWGSNTSGQLGDGTTSGSATPVAIAGGVTFVSLSAGSDQTCGITTTGTSYCWGRNGVGQLGDGTVQDRRRPVTVSGGHTFASVSAGNAYTCAVRTDGLAFCWGANNTGQLGNPTMTTQSASPLAVAGGLTFASVTTGWFHACALRTGGAAYCWGSNNSGQVGDGTTINPRPGPVGVAGGHSFASVSAGASHTCGVRTDGTAYCWGLNNVGQLAASGVGTQSRNPAAVQGGLVFASVSAGGSQTCGVTTGGVLYCWGGNAAGQLGNGTTTNAWTPVPVTVSAGLTFVSVAAGSQHTCGIASGGGAYCWGDNSSGQLGDGTTTQRRTPVPVRGGLTFASLSASFAHTCGVTTSGTEYCWGQAGFGQMGDGTTIGQRLTPVTAVGGLMFKSVDAGGTHTCGVTTGGTAHCWGSNSSGQLGDGTTNPRRTPAALSLPANLVVSISAGSGHTCAVTGVAGAYCWGTNSYGQLGDGTTTQRLTPVPVAGGLAFGWVSAGLNHTCAVRVGGGAYCWGTNSSGHLGTGTTISSAAPVAVHGGVVLTLISAGTSYTCGVVGVGSAYCWGQNTFGKLGDGTQSTSYMPVRVLVP